MEILNDGFFNQYTDDFFEYFERHKNIKKNKEYFELITQIEYLKTKYPKVRSFLEDKEIINFSETEKMGLLKILDLQEELSILDLKESFKLGFKEAYIYFRSMNMLNI